ncbi:glucose-1-phosphate adenylyltransferase [Opitutales bacterium ASA1]|uniref:glucose-1-phosphate adenylyltransferase n=1 Tax=Congregicoccus parvus TaxID=3081749 RepID=UPI002B2B4BE3|nr:glucose-1-phosphate adenylyltransferase [Opitutales bacterium ASA1]
MTLEQNVLAVIMGGGRGSRLYPLTKERCKPAVPLAGKYRLVDIPISNCLNSGINRIFLLTQFNTASLHRHIQSSYRFDPFSGGNVEILSAEQTEKGDNWYQGTADAVRQNLHHFADHKHDIVLILSGDQLYRMDFRKILEQHVATKAHVTIAALPVPKSQVEGLGVMRVNDDLSIAEFAEKPKDPAVIDRLVLSEEVQSKLKFATSGEHCLASMGIYVFNRRSLVEALNNNMTDFGKEVIPSLLGRARLFSYIFEGYWEDIGTVRAFFEANLQLTDLVPPFNFFTAGAPVYTHARYLPASKINRCTFDHVIIGDGSIITEAHLKRCVVGIRSVVREGCRLENVVIMGADDYENERDIRANAENGVPNVGVGHNTVVKDAIIDKGARIGSNVVLDPAGKPSDWEGHGVYIRDGVLVVPKNAIIPNNTVI